MIIELSSQKKGELFLLSETIISGFFPIVALLTYQYISPLFSLLISSSFALLFFAFLVVVRKKYSQLKEKSAYKNILISSILIMLLFLFFFIGLQYTTPSNASVILFMQVFFSYLFFRIFKNEKLQRAHIFGAILMSVGAILILFPGEIKFNRGDFLILISASIAPVANHFQRLSREVVDAEVLLFFRTLFALPFLSIIALYFEEIPKLEDIKNVFWLLLFNGILAFGLSKIFWVEAIYRISITKAAAMAAMTPFFTMIFSYMFISMPPTIYQILGALPIAIGSYFITRKEKDKINH